MAGRTKKKSKKSEPSGWIDAVCEGVRRLLTNHREEIEKVMAESEQNIVSIGHSSVMDGSEAETVIKTKLKFVQAVTDSVTMRLDDPSQGRFQFVDKDEADPEAEAEEDGKETEVVTTAGR